MHQDKRRRSVIIKSSIGIFAVLAIATAPAMADQFYDAGVKSFQTKKYKEAAAYFEQSIKAAPWESSAFYYCALAYHYLRDFKKASEKYGQCVERFPGTQACNQSMDALKVIDPDYFKRKAAAIKEAEERNRIQGAKTGSSAGGSGPTGKDMGTVEGDQTRVMFHKNQNDMVVSVQVNGRNTPAIFDPNGESTTFSRQQLQSVAINVPKGTIEFRCDITLGGIKRKNFPITIDDSGAAARLGTSFTDQFSVNINEGAKQIDLKRKSASGPNAVAVGFTKDGKTLVVSAEVNGRPTQMAFEPNESGVSFTTKQAKSAGLKVDDADSLHKAPGEGPQRGEAGWVPDEDRAAPPKVLGIRFKFGPVERTNVSCQVSEQGNDKYPKFGADFITGGGYKYDIDYKSSKINFSRN